MQKVIISSSQKQTQKIGEDFAARLHLTIRSNLGLRSHLRQAEVIALHGNLGSGKTTFMQGFANGLGVQTRIISPTFIIIRQYNLHDYASSEALRSREVQDSNSSRITPFARTVSFYHIDLYRLESQKDIESLGIDEIISNPENIVAIEWAEKMGELLPKNRWDLRFEYIDENKRKVSICHPEFISGSIK